MNRSSKKMLTAILSAVFAGGTALGYFAPSAISNGHGVQELRTTHEKDMASLRAALDALTVSAAKSEAKLDLLVTMVRDHTQGDRP